MTPSATTLSPTGVLQPANAGAVEPSANATTAGTRTALIARTRTPAPELSLVRNADYLGRLYACRATTVQSMRWRPRHRAHQHAARGDCRYAGGLRLSWTLPVSSSSSSSLSRSLAAPLRRAQHGPHAAA